MNNSAATPPPLIASAPGSFAYRTITQRLPRIVEQVIADNTLTQAQRDALAAMLDDLRHAPLRPLRDAQPDGAIWEALCRPYDGTRWFDTPFLFAEFYFYRRLLEALDYFRAPQRVDPYASVKEQSLQHAMHASRGSLPDDFRGTRDDLSALLHLTLAGNQADLSLAPGESMVGKSGAPRPIVVGQTDALLSVLEGRPGGTVALILDNVGPELVADLLFADALLLGGMAADVILHAKHYPTFVSDAVADDVHHTVNVMAADEDRRLRTVGRRLGDALTKGSLVVGDDPAWNLPLHFGDLPSGLHSALASSRMVLAKGDANYRRLVGDLHWPIPTPFADVVAYFPTDVAAVRMLKSELLVGLEASRAEELRATDPDWLIDGRWGVIQLAQKRS